MSRAVEELPVSRDGFTVPASEILTGRGFITGKSGSGKSNTANVLAEELLERNLPFMIVDTDGEYFGLKERYELLHAGVDADCDMELARGMGEQIATIALEENVPVILDVSGFFDEEEAADVVYDVVSALFVEEKSRRKPFLLFVEEAHEFIPQRGGGDDLSKMLIRVAKRGRKRGLGMCAMSQRPAAVDKDYITQCDWMVWHRLTWDNDTAVVDRILGSAAAETVQALDTGEAIVMTDWDEAVDRVRFRKKWTYDAGSTPDLSDVDYATAPSERSAVVSDLLGDSQRPGLGDEADGADGTNGVDELADGDQSEPGDGHEVDERNSVPVRDRLDGSDSGLDAGGTDAAIGANERDESSTSTADSFDPVWEAGVATVHLWLYCWRSLLWYVDEVERYLNRSLAPRCVGGQRASPAAIQLPGATDGIARTVSTAVVAASFVLLFLLVLLVI